MDPVDWARRYAKMITERWGGICRIDSLCRETAFGGTDGDYFVEVGCKAPENLSELVRFFYEQEEGSLAPKC